MLFRSAIDTESYIEAEEFKAAMNLFLPMGIRIAEALNVRIPSGHKKYSVSSLLWGYTYTDENGKPVLVKFDEEKSFRLSRVGPNGSVFGLERLSVLAGSKTDSMGQSYFKIYRDIYQ